MTAGKPCYQHPDCDCLGPCQQEQTAAAAATERERNAAGQAAPTFQIRAFGWAQSCFGTPVALNRPERTHRFLEEALEMAQASGATREEAAQLLDYIYSRPAGDPTQEAGGVMLTLATLCAASGIHLAQAAEAELVRVWRKLPQIRAKQAAARAGSPLPGHADRDAEP